MVINTSYGLYDKDENMIFSCEKLTDMDKFLHIEKGSVSRYINRYKEEEIFKYLNPKTNDYECSQCIFRFKNGDSIWEFWIERRI